MITRRQFLIKQAAVSAAALLPPPVTAAVMAAAENIPTNDGVSKNVPVFIYDDDGNMLASGVTTAQRTGFLEFKLDGFECPIERSGIATCVAYKIGPQLYCARLSAPQCLHAPQFVTLEF